MLRKIKIHSAESETALLTKKMRWLIWATFVISCINIGQSGGIMSPGAKTIKTELGMMDLEYSCFSPMYAIGRICGSFLLVSIINVVNRKWMVVFALFLKSATVAVFKFSSDGYFLMGCRLMSGIGHIIPVVYAPIWVNQFNIKKSKYIMTSGLSVASPVGRSSGFLMDLFLGSENWRNGFFINGCNLAICGIIFMLYPSIYFSSKLTATTGKDGIEEFRPSEARVVSIFAIRDSTADEREINCFRKYSVIFTNPVYIFLVFGRCCITAINSIFTFWIPSYVTDVLGYQDKFRKTLMYVFMICTGPFTGSFIGGYATAKVGGYEKKNSILIVLCLNFFACCVLTPMPFVNEWYLFLICCYSFHICGNAVLPNLNGIILSSIPGPLKTKGYIIANIAANVLGSLPSPSIYGLINDKWKAYDKRFPMKYFLFVSWMGVVWLTLAYICRIRREEEKEKSEPFKKPDKSVELKESAQNINDGTRGDLTIENKEEEGTELKA